MPPSTRSKQPSAPYNKTSSTLNNKQPEEPTPELKAQASIPAKVQASTPTPASPTSQVTITSPTSTSKK
jgi:hypothetical protein